MNLKLLIAFGNFLLSAERRANYEAISTENLEERLGQVSDADIQNFFDTHKEEFGPPSELALDDNSLGARRVRVKFNAGNNNLVQNLKEHFAHSINRIEKLRSRNVSPEDRGELNRTISQAQTAIEDAAMYAVKAATYETVEE